MPALPDQPKKPWSMKWIVLAIILFMGAYTYLTLHFRKANRSFEPYNDIKNRGQTHNLLTAGYQRVTLSAELPTNELPLESSARISAAGGGLPGDLVTSLFDQPRLPDSYQGVQAPAQISGLLPFRIIFDCAVADNHQQFGAAYLYIRGNTIVLAPEFEKLDGELLSRNRTSHVQLTIPGGAIKPGQYEVLLAGRTASRTWTMQVN
ncbi:MAG: hypothetical protein K9N01_12185 [Cephaloticoccus sp.]|nr:hypothetical protein [Cephaloticoccus sp.]